MLKIIIAGLYVFDLLLIFISNLNTIFVKEKTFFFFTTHETFYSAQFYVTWPTTTPSRQFSFSYSKYVRKHICSLRVTNDLYWCAVHPFAVIDLLAPKISLNVISQSNELLPKHHTAKMPIKYYSSFAEGNFEVSTKLM